MTDALTDSPTPTRTTPTGDESLDEGSLDGLDLTPRQPLRTPSQTRHRRSYRNTAILSVLAVVLGFVLYQALTSARVYYLNVDEAVAKRSDMGTQTLRMQGEVTATSGHDASGALVFTLAFGDAAAQVRHVGDEPTDLFGVGQKAVVDGHWVGEVFESRQILMKHSEQYVEANPDRLNYEVTTTTPAGG